MIIITTEQCFATDDVSLVFCWPI